MLKIKNQLDRLAELEAKKDVLQQEKQKQIDAILTPEIKAKIADIETDFEIRTKGVNESVKTLRDEIKSGVLEHGEKVRGQFLQAVYTKGRSSWDTKGLKGYAKANPEVLDFYKQGNPYVSIRKVGNK